MKHINFKNSLAICLLLCVVLLWGCKKERTYNFTQDDIMVIFENGYRSGVKNVLEYNYSEDIWKKDSLIMAQHWQE